MTETRQSGFKTNPDYRITFEKSPRRVRVRFNGATIVDSIQAHLLFETRHLPVYYFPPSDVRMDLLTASAHQTFCPYKGDASYWTVTVGDKIAENAVWSYRTPFDEVAAIKDYVALYWNKMDAWLEEDEEIFVHPRDPYKRVDVIDSSRHVRVVLGGETVADTRRARTASNCRACRVSHRRCHRSCLGLLRRRGRRRVGRMTRRRPQPRFVTCSSRPGSDRR